MQDTMLVKQFHMEVTALEQLNTVTGCLQETLQQFDVSEERQIDLKLCVMEAVQNALLHGGTASITPTAQISWRCDEAAFRFTVEDNGTGISQELRTDAYQETLKESGRGLLLMRTILDEVHFNEQGNVITGILRW